MYGTNPMAFGFPRAGGQLPLVWDQASAAMARGEVQLHLRDGNRPLPPGTAIDAAGEPTTDPAAALEATEPAPLRITGSRALTSADSSAVFISFSADSPDCVAGAVVVQGSQLAFGGHKGTAIALMVELLAAGLSGSNFSYEATAEDPGWNGPTSNGEFIMAISPATVSGGDGFGAHCESLFERILDEPGTRLPSQRRYDNRAAGGPVELPTALYDEIGDIVAGRVRTTGRF